MPDRRSIRSLKDLRSREDKLVALTAYDYPVARLLDEAGIDIILVGDSLGMVFAGLPDTTGVTIDQMVYHTSVVARAVKNTPIVGDMPFHSYDTIPQTLESARRLVEAGADAVKLEGGTTQRDKVAALTGQGIQVVGHIGMLPQRVREEGGYKKKGRTPEDAGRLLQSAKDLEEAGADAIVLEGIVPPVAARITEEIGIPTIGIGSGRSCGGQILVIHDLIGAYPWFVPPFAIPRADVAGEIRRAVAEYRDDIRAAK